MELNDNEKFLLAIYLEYFGREYDVNDDRVLKVGKEFLKRHIEMQNICYLLNNYDTSLVEDYGFGWDLIGPYSPGLSVKQNELDTKQTEITAFYKEYNDKRRYNFASNYANQLQELLKDFCMSYQTSKIAFSSFVLEDIMRYENGSIILAGIIYLYKNILPRANKNAIFEELEKRLSIYGICVNSEQEEIAWRCAQIIGLIDIKKKYPVEKQNELIRVVKK